MGYKQWVFGKDIYMPVVQKAWNYLSKKALQKDGTVGYVQPIGEKQSLDK